MKTMNFIYHREKFILVASIPQIQGVFSTLLIEDGKLFFFKEHIQRIKEHCKTAHIDFPGLEITVLRKLILLNQFTQGRYRLRVIVSNKGLTVTLEKEPPYKKEIHLCFYPHPLSIFAPNIKMWPYTKRKKMLFYAQNQKADDCLTFDSFGNLLEAGVGNVFWIRKNTFFYPDPALSYFKGIVLEQAISIAKELQLSVKSGIFSYKDLDQSTVFYCNSIKGILPVKYLENQKLFFDQTLINLYLQLYRNVAHASATNL